MDFGHKLNCNLWSTCHFMNERYVNILFIFINGDVTDIWKLQLGVDKIIWFFENMSHKIQHLRNYNDTGVIKVNPTQNHEPSLPICNQPTGNILGNEATTITYNEPINSPLSPSSAFHKTVLPKELNIGFIKTVILCHWDNILGPKTLNTWEVEQRETTPNKVLTQLCSQLLSGEVCRDINENFVDFKFLDLVELDVILVGYVFVARGASDLSIHSLAFVIPRVHLKLYMEISALLNKCLLGIIQKLRRFLHMVCSTFYTRFRNKYLIV